MLFHQAIADQEICHDTRQYLLSEGSSIGRPKKNKELPIGREGRNAIEREDLAREALRWQRRKQTIERFKGISKLQDTAHWVTEEVNLSDDMKHAGRVVVLSRLLLKEYLWWYLNITHIFYMLSKFIVPACLHAVIVMLYGWIQYA